MDSEKLRIQYQDNIGRADRLREAVITQLLELFKNNNVTLGVPIESRIKDWSSISEKIERKNMQLQNLLDLQDLIGVRSILLFKRDLAQVHDLISKTFEIESAEDTGDRLGDSEFGYQSQHYIVKIPTSWLSLPSLAGLDEFFVELQVRTLAQHIWAAASHKLQYKQEAGVPPPVRRAINRVSALLETVDLEFERVLNEREEYTIHSKISDEPDESLYVDNLVSTLAEVFPAENLYEHEAYADLLKELLKLGVTTTGRLRKILKAHLDEALELDRQKVSDPETQMGMPPNSIAYKRVEQGVFYTHVGLARSILRLEFGQEKVDEAMADNFPYPQSLYVSEEST
jgi:ppGpp synthetase/RelA/SpoT-type nucleotidyltranferase